MLTPIISGNEADVARSWIEQAAILIELVAVAIIVLAIISALARYLFRYVGHQERDTLYHELKVSLGKSLLLGLEILVAADVIHTVALEATPQSVLVLGLLVLIRTFLSWALVVEIEGRWPWQQRSVSPDQSAHSRDAASL
ncbi:MAG: DUF1622 domain-containing protein [Anaerolineae bacterium]|uniref:DUF1622 domain-containing protein n=1 Tax=Promineifilum sp. TaxID=2664178 RepID=UPI001E019257|nr:DUF1622 domain-containing protein [Anaerolineales bacterium]MCO5179036.1 DUF1622 domain-containing protein [Promineifilum sp.]MCW5846272.1 DUF1622 domain-containing protein [Anaerolineae bacterium]